MSTRGCDTSSLLHRASALEERSRICDMFSAHLSHLRMRQLQGRLKMRQMQVLWSLNQRRCMPRMSHSQCPAQRQRHSLHFGSLQLTLCTPLAE